MLHPEAGVTVYNTMGRQIWGWVVEEGTEHMNIEDTWESPPSGEGGGDHTGQSMKSQLPSTCWPL